MALPLGKKIDALPFPVHVRYKGLFDFEGLYQFMYNWLQNRHWKFHEDLYKDKIDTALGNEIEIKWRGERKITEFVQKSINIYIHIWTGKEVEVNEGNKKKRMMKGRMDIEFKGHIILDYTGMFKGSPGRSAMGKMMSWIRTKEFEAKFIDPLYYEIFKYQAEVKKFLNIEAKENSYG